MSRKGSGRRFQETFPAVTERLPGILDNSIDFDRQTIFRGFHRYFKVFQGVLKPLPLRDVSSVSRHLRFRGLERLSSGLPMDLSAFHIGFQTGSSKEFEVFHGIL